MTILGGIALVLAVIMVAGPIRGGYDMAMLRLIRGDDSVSFRDLFAGFSKFRKLFLTFLLYSLADEYDVHGAGAMRSDPMVGDPSCYLEGAGPQKDTIRIHNYARCVRKIGLPKEKHHLPI